MDALRAGTKAPDFSLPCTPDQQCSLAELKGENTVLVFYPADWSPVCGDQLALYSELHEEFEKLHAHMLAISVDSAWSHVAFAKDRKYKGITLLSDFEPKGAVAKKFGAYREHDGTCERALFVLDRDGVVQWSYVSPVAINPGADGILRALEKLNERKPHHAKNKRSA
jgi:peroxiredoxin